MEKEIKGLQEKEAKRRLFEYGENTLAAGKKINMLKIFGGQFKDLMIIILLASTFISVLMGETVEAISIVVIVLLNAILGFVQEYRTEKTLETLKNMAAPTASVIRDGHTQSIPAAEIVPGDVIKIKAGDKIPADAVIIEAVSLECDEALLTGESLPVQKKPSAGASAGNETLVYMGAIVTKGRGKAVVQSTGMSTEMGKIAAMLHEIEDEPTPLQKKLSQLGKYIAAGCLGICFIVAAAGVLRGYPLFDMLITGISLAVAAVPEGLPAIVTIALALAVSRILKRNALVRKLHSVETLGCANVICTDKTGTLTENKMTVKQISTFDCNVQVSGSGHRQTGELTADGRRINPANMPTLKKLLEIAVICNNSAITPTAGTIKPRNRSENTAYTKPAFADKFSKAFGGKASSLSETPHSESNIAEWETSGDPTEIALLIMAAKANTDKSSLSFDTYNEIPFDSDRKMMTVLVRDKSGRSLAFSKGAPDVLLGRCKYILTAGGVQLLTPAVMAGIVKTNAEMAGKALRVLGFALKESPSSLSTCEADMVFVGLAGMIDPPRSQVYDAVAKCGRAKIRTVMITGDHAETAKAIAVDTGIYKHGDIVMTGKEIDAMEQTAFEKIVHKVSVFARVTPAHKLLIVKSLKKRGNIVAMTGDGVNDAPAVKEADIGVAMGISGTDVTKSAASIILLDDNFATLVATVEEGRAVYSNIRKFIRYLLSCNIGEVVTMFAGMLMGLPLVLLPIQILLVNLATDGLPALALSLEPAEDETMAQKPRSATDSVFSGGLAGTIIFRGILIGFTTLLVFTSFARRYGSIDIARTAALLTLVATQLVHVFECKSERKSIFGINPTNNPFLIFAVFISAALIFLTVYHPAMQMIFSTVSLTAEQILRVLLYAAVVPVLSAVSVIIAGRKPKPDIIEAPQAEL